MKTYKGTGNNGKRKDIGTGELSKAEGSKVSMTTGGKTSMSVKDDDCTPPRCKSK